MLLKKTIKILLSIIIIIALAESFLRFYDFIFGKTVNNIKNNNKILIIKTTPTRFIPVEKIKVGIKFT